MRTALIMALVLGLLLAGCSTHSSKSAPINKPNIQDESHDGLQPAEQAESQNIDSDISTLDKELSEIDSLDLEADSLDNLDQDLDAIIG